MKISDLARQLYEEAYREVRDHKLAESIASKMLMEALKPTKETQTTDAEKGHKNAITNT